MSSKIKPIIHSNKIPVLTPHNGENIFNLILLSMLANSEI